MTIDNDKINQLEKLIDNAKDIVLMVHANPDGDNLGSALGLYHVLKNAGKKPSIVSTDSFADFYTFLPGIDKVNVFYKSADIVKDLMHTAELIFCMDFNAPHRVGKLEDILKQTMAPKVLIDHHLYPDENFFDLMFSRPGTSSTAELLYHILKKSKYASDIDYNAALSIFVGIMTDTGSYSHSCNDPETFEVSAELIRYGIDVKKVNDLVYNNSSEQRLRLLGYAISEKLVSRPEHKAAYFTLSREELKRFNEQPGDTEGLVNYGLSIRGIDFSALLTEKEDLVKISFRSKENLNVNRFARDYFNGGGHINAAGGRSYENLEKTVEKLESLLPKLKEYYD